MENEKIIEDFAFCDDKTLESITIPYGVVSIGKGAFKGCEALTTVIIPDSVTTIKDSAFEGCTALSSISIPESVVSIEEGAFAYCESLSEICLPGGLSEVSENLFYLCHGLKAVEIKGHVASVRSNAFYGCNSLCKLSFKEGLKTIENRAFAECTSLESITLPQGVQTIGRWAFADCESLSKLEIPEGLTTIENSQIQGCTSLKTLIVPESVKEIDEDLYVLDDVTVVCRENSYIHSFCVKNNLSYIFDYMYRAFGGLLPQRSEVIAAPFEADEEKPFVFISYRHADRKEVFEVILKLYERGFRLWYDEGLCIGDRYDEVIGGHVKESAAFLLFVTENSAASEYICEKEIPWAIEHHKPIIKYYLHEGIDCEIKDYDNVSPVSGSPYEIENKLIENGVAKGEERTAKGISVLVDLDNRNEDADAIDYQTKGFAYCMYSEQGCDKAKTILHNLKNSACAIWDAGHEDDEDKMAESTCLIAFIDEAFMSDIHMVDVLKREFRKGKTIIHCHFEDTVFPDELMPLLDVQGLRFDTSNSHDFYAKLEKYLTDEGCRKRDNIPEFDYLETEDGIVLTKYKGREIHVKIETAYGGRTVVALGENIFENCKTISEIVIPKSVSVIGNYAMKGCESLVSVELDEGLRSIGEGAFKDCINLKSIILPSSLKSVGEEAFAGCESLAQLTIKPGVEVLGENAFMDCFALKSLTIPGSVKEMGRGVFFNCKNLEGVTIAEGVRIVGERAFRWCNNLTTVNLPDSLKCIEEDAFEGCYALSSIEIPNKVTKIARGAFSRCESLKDIKIPKSII